MAFCTAAAPLLPRRLFASPVCSGANAARMMLISAMMGFFFLNTQLLQGELGFTAVQAGLGFLPMTVVTFLASLALPRLTRAMSDSGVLVLAFACAAGRLFWLSFAGPGHSYLTSVALPKLLLRFGNGTALAPLTIP